MCIYICIYIYTHHISPLKSPFFTSHFKPPGPVFTAFFGHLVVLAIFLQFAHALLFHPTLCLGSFDGFMMDLKNNDSPMATKNTKKNRPIDGSIMVNLCEYQTKPQVD